MRWKPYLAALLAAVCFLTACDFEKPVQDSEGFTLMLYMIGSELEEASGLASADIQELLHADLQQGVSVYLMTGGCRQWHNGISENELSVYRIENHELNKVRTQALADMTDSKTLADYLRFVFDQQGGLGDYSLVLWDHGMGPLEGYGVDTAYGGNSMSLPALTDALEESPFGRDRMLSWIGFDACLMATLETGLALSDYTNYLLASQEVEPKFGWDYSFLDKIFPAQQPEEQMGLIGDAYMEYYHKLCKNMPNYDPVRTLSCLSLQKIPEVIETLDAIVQKSREKDQAERVRGFVQKRTGAVNIGRYSTGQTYDLIDLGSFAELIQDFDPENSVRLMEHMAELVLKNWSNVDYSTGISLYSPWDNLEEYENSWQPRFEEISVSDAYYDFVNTIYQTSQANDGDCFEDGLLPKAEETSTGYAISLALTSEQIENYASGRVWIFSEEQLKDMFDIEGQEQTRLVLRYAFPVRESDMTGRRMSVNYDGSLFATVDPQGNEHVICVLSSESARGMCLCSLLDESNGDEQSVWLQVENLQTGTPKVAGAVPLGEEEGDFTSLYARGKREYDLNQWDTIEFVSLVYSFSENGYVIDTNDVFWTWYPINGRIELKTVKPSSPLYAMFVITDLTGKTHASKIVRMEGLQD